MKWKSKYLLVGAGKVTRSFAELYPGDCLCLTEDGEETRLLSFSSDWEIQASFQGSLDDLDWEMFNFEKVILSPGVNPNRSFFSEQLKAKEIRELDVFFQAFDGRIIGVTGTNGKSTATFQIGYLLEKILGKEKVFVGGNLGTPMLEALRSAPQADWAVLELSSYQLERLKFAKFDIGLLLNLSPDHLDRYDSVDDYFLTKWELPYRAKHPVFPQEFSAPKTPLRSAIDFSLEDSLSRVLEKTIGFMSARKLLPSKALSEIDFENLPRLPHRMEVFLHRHGFKAVNDSKATNVNSVLYALRQLSSDPMKGCLHLILGGKAKGDDFSLLVPHLRNFDAKLWVYGVDRERVRAGLAAFEGRIELVEKLSDLINRILVEIKSQDVLLLSPGCASFDQFKNYEERGEFFKKALS